MVKEIVFSPKQKQIIRAPFDHELEVNEGTPRSGKTTGGHFRFARFLLETNDTNHLIAAYNQEQAFRLFIDGDGTGLMHIFEGNCQIKHDEHGDHLLVYTPKGERRVYYKGAGKANSVGAITGMSLGSVVFCEINLLHMSFIQEAFRRTMAAHIPYHLADLNPPSPMHPVIKEVFEVRDMRWTHWTMDDNPILTKERKEKLIETLKKSPYLYQRDVEGKRVMPQGVIYSNFSMTENVDSVLKGEVVETYFVADAGQSDATTCSYNIVTMQRKEDGTYQHHLYRVANYYHSGADTGETKAMSTYAQEIKQFMRWCFQKWGYHHSALFVDPAAKSLREELKKIGVANKKADNNASDQVSKEKMRIEVGIERAKTCIDEGYFSLLETDEYDHYHFLQEVGLYVRDTNGNPVDDNNHCMDEFRYSINYFYKKYIKR
ncbi:PBSX family phage terminase large subunit [Atopococcus tabaci]|uniref:PBSX family phage terminase large subunit n=1 Tax=Atopococcus tabaci TaxID=269774 RepID=UPI0024099A4D|nr:PBSX family phage terminase large subunit [Atopococcus tabaci]